MTGTIVSKCAMLIRLNQNYFVGLGIERLERRQIDLLYGGSVALWAFIPAQFGRKNPTWEAGAI